MILALSLLLRRSQREVIKPRPTKEPQGPGLYSRQRFKVDAGSVGDREAYYPLAAVALANGALVPDESHSVWQFVTCQRCDRVEQRVGQRESLS